MTAVKLQGTFKKDQREFNGLEAIADELIAHPHKRYVIVALVECVGYDVDFADGGTKTPKVRLVAVEAMEGDHAATAQKYLDESYNGRTGKTAPPPTLFDDSDPEDEAEDQGDEPGQPAVADGAPEADGAGNWPGDPEYVAPSPAFSDPEVVTSITGRRGRR